MEFGKRSKKPISDEFEVNPISTWLNPGIKTIEQLKDWIQVRLGATGVNVELTDVQLNCAIADGMAMYSKYAQAIEQYLTVNLRYYKPGIGIDLKEFNIMSVKNIAFQKDNIFGMQNDMFFGPYAFTGQGIGSPMFGMGGTNPVGTWTMYHNMHEFFDLTQRMNGSQPDFYYDKSSKILKLMPEPRCQNMDEFILVTCNVEPPPEEYFGNEYCRRLILGYAKQILGTVLRKFSGTQLLGGGTINSDFAAEGKEEIDKAVDELIKSESRGQCFYLS